MTDHQIFEAFSTLLGYAARTADLAILRQLNPGGVTVKSLAEYIWDHHMGEPDEHTLEEVGHEILQLMVYDEQYRLIKDKYGEKAAEATNYGWGVDVQGDAVSVATKVYPEVVNQVLTSNSALSQPEITHEWRDYVAPTASALD